jgi:hypothetical protein
MPTPAVASERGAAMRLRKIAFVTSVIVAAMVTGACSGEENGGGGPAGGLNTDGSPSGDSSSGERLARYRQRFEQARENAALVRGRLLPQATVNCRAMQATDPQSGYSLKLGATESNRGYIMLYWPAGSSDLPLHGDSEQMASDDGYERIVSISNTSFYKDGRSNRRSLDQEQLQLVADLVATLQNSCTDGRTREIASFVLYDEGGRSEPSSTGD